MEFKEIIQEIEDNCGEVIAKVVSNQAAKLREADTEIDDGLKEIESLKGKIEEYKGLEVENSRMKKLQKDLEKKLEDVNSREQSISHTEEINRLKVENAEKIVDTLMDFAKILSGGREEKNVRPRRKTKQDDE